MSDANPPGPFGLPPATQAENQADARRVSGAMEEWRKRSRLINFYRRALPIGIGLVALSLFGWVGIKSLLANWGETAGRTGNIRMTNPRFYGQDGQGRSFVLGAAEAVRETRPNEHITLTLPMLRLTTGPNRTMEISARSGAYDQKTRQARLAGQVKVSDSGSGFELLTGEARVDTRSGNVAGNSQVVGRGPLGEIRASSYAISEQGSRMVFKGNVHARIEQRRR